MRPAPPSFQGQNWIQIDICQAENWLKVPKVETVFHLAARTGVRDSLSHAAAYLRTNIEGTANLLNWCAHTQTEQIVLASSSSVYGGSQGSPLKETAIPRPTSPYAVSKLAAENLLAAYALNHALKGVALRFFTVYGPGQRQDMGLYHFASNLSQGLPLLLFDPETTSRDMTYISDIINGMLKAEVWLKAFQGTGSFAVFNLGSGQSIRLSDLVSELENISGLKASEKRILPHPPGDVSQTLASNEKAKTYLGYNPTTSFQNGLQEFWNWFSNQGSR